MLKEKVLKVRHLLMVAMFAVTLLACSVPSMQQSSNPATTSESKPAVPTHTTTSTSYILAEPLPNKKLRISITAKEKSLRINNCNESITVALFEKDKKDVVWGGVSDACRSLDMIIPQGATLSFITKIDDSSQPLDLNKNYQAQLFGLTYDPNITTNRITSTENLSNEFKLIP